MKKISILTLLAISVAPIAQAQAQTQEQVQDATGYHAFIKYRNFGAKKGVASTPEFIVADPNGGKNIFPSINSFAMTYLGNMGRTVQDTIGYGDWDKQNRYMIGYEQNYIKSKNSSSSYGYHSDIGNLFIQADKKVSDNIRLGGGLVIGAYNSDYVVSDMYQNTQNIMSTYHFIYRNKEQDILHRSILYLGYGHTDLRRVSNTGVHKSDFSTLYYALENIAYKNIKLGPSKFYLRPTAEINYYGTKQEGFREDGLGFDLAHNSAYKIDVGLALYAGYKATKYDLRIGYDWTSILSDPRKAYTIDYYNGTSIELEKKTSDQNYGTWRASMSYKITQDTSFISDIRYYDRQSDNIMFTLGINYNF